MVRKSRLALAGVVVAFNGLVAGGCAVPPGAAPYHPHADYDCARLESAANRRDNMPGTVNGVIALRRQSLWPHEQRALQDAARRISPDAPPACREAILATELDTTQLTTMAANACTRASEPQQKATEQAYMNRAAAWRQRIEHACRPQPYGIPSYPRSPDYGRY